MGRGPIIDGSASRHAPAVISKGCQHQEQPTLGRTTEARTINCRTKMAGTRWNGCVGRRHRTGSASQSVCGQDSATGNGETRQVDAAARSHWQLSSTAPEACLVLRISRIRCQRQHLALVMQTSQREKQGCARRGAQPWSLDTALSRSHVIDSRYEPSRQGEAEFYALTKAAAHAKQLAGIMNVLECPAGAVVGSDATAGIGVARIQGCGRLRPLGATRLWV